MITMDITIAMYMAVELNGRTPCVRIALLYSLGEKDILSIKSLIMRGANPINGIEDQTQQVD